MSGTTRLVSNEASADCESNHSTSHYRANGRKFPPIGNEIDISKHSVFKDPDDAECPVVVYIPMRKNTEVDHDFDPQTCADHGFLDTLNFCYTEEQFDLWTDLMKHNVLDARSDLLQALSFKLEQLSGDES